MLEETIVPFDLSSSMILTILPLSRTTLSFSIDANCWESKGKDAGIRIAISRMSRIFISLKLALTVNIAYFDIFGIDKQSAK